MSIRSYGIDFLEAFEHLIVDEGVESNDPRDPGGYTRYGVSSVAWPNLDLANMTKDDFKEFYFVNYWNAVCAGSFPNAIGDVLFDAAVNQGVVWAIRMAQTTVGVSVDGIMGPVTRAKIEQYNLVRFVERYTTCRIRRYMNTKNFETFGDGWITRAIRVAIRAMR